MGATSSLPMTPLHTILLHKPAVTLIVCIHDGSTFYSCCLSEHCHDSPQVLALFVNWLQTLCSVVMCGNIDAVCRCWACFPYYPRPSGGKLLLDTHKPRA
eukprot:GHRR01030658.1.p1 GENE.GHRR01030658.1~~GHRR01030658.1.p1  ORF type:complete len:100 (-),score=10.04 GHRR01030658.1:236-535(-)